MANDVIFNKGQGGLGRPLAGTDYISGRRGQAGRGG